MRQQVLELLETLVDLIQQHDFVAARRGAESRGSLQTLKGLSEMLLPAYGATLSGGDKAILRTLHVLDTLMRQLSGHETPSGPLALLSGPLSESE